jgi:hypothetical protein
MPLSFLSGISLPLFCWTMICTSFSEPVVCIFSFNLSHPTHDIARLKRNASTAHKIYFGLQKMSDKTCAFIT